MCTIGNTFSINEGNITFKQCDLPKKVNFCKPEIIRSRKGIFYMPFMRDGSKGAWCGINQFGVSFVAADSYLDKENGDIKTVSGDIFEQYLKIITDCISAKEAAYMMKEFYETKFPDADILMITDAMSAYFIEAYNGRVQMVERHAGFFASTNHFRMIYGAAPYAKNHSTYLRLQRAESILQVSPNFSGVDNLLKDSYYGDSVWSICRSAKENEVPVQEEPYFTQASAIFTVKQGRGKVIVDCSYLINGNPSNKEWTNMFDIFPPPPYDETKEVMDELIINN